MIKLLYILLDMTIGSRGPVDPSQTQEDRGVVTFWPRVWIDLWNWTRQIRVDKGPIINELFSYWIFLFLILNSMFLIKHLSNF